MQHLLNHNNLYIRTFNIDRGIQQMHRNIDYCIT
jgi:hypothetical protein